MSKAKFIKELEQTPPTKENFRKATIELVKRKSPIIMADVTDAKILISRQGYQLQAHKDVDVLKSKAITHTANSYINAVKVLDLVERIEELEKKLQI